MRNIAIGAFCLFAWCISAVESEIQFENDLVRASKVKIKAHEDMGLERNEYPQVVVSLKGGTITYLGADGSTIEVDFPKGEAVFREADPLGLFHKSTNNTCKPIELIVIELKRGSS